MEGWLQGFECGSPWGPLDILQGEAPRGDVYQGHHLFQGTEEGTLGGEGARRAWSSWIMWYLSVYLWYPTGLFSHVPNPTVMTLTLTWVSVPCLLPCTDCKLKVNLVWLHSCNRLTTHFARPGRCSRC